MKLTNEEIARVFAMYLYRQMITPMGNRILLSSYQLNYYIKDLDSCKIELAPLAAITDEHAIEVARLCFQMPNSNFTIEKKDKHGFHIYRREENGIIYHARINFSGEVKPNMQFEADEKEPYRSFSHQIGAISLTDRRPIPYLAIVDFYRMNGYDTPLFFGINHWANGKTAIELGIAIVNKRNKVAVS